MRLHLLWWAAWRLRGRMNRNVIQCCLINGWDLQSCMEFQKCRLGNRFTVSTVGNWFFYLNVPKLNSSGCVTCLAEMKKADQACSVCQFSDREREPEFFSFGDESFSKILSYSQYLTKIIRLVCRMSHNVSLVILNKNYCIRSKIPV